MRRLSMFERTCIDDTGSEGENMKAIKEAY